MSYDPIQGTEVAKMTDFNVYHLRRCACK